MVLRQGYKQFSGQPVIPREREAGDGRASAMVLSTRLQLRAAPSIALTPQMLQAIRLLQMSALEVDRHVETELAANPLLQRIEGTPGTTPSSRDMPPGYLGRRIAGYSADSGVRSASPVDTIIGETVPAIESLHDRLSAQIELEFPEPSQRLIAWQLVGALDPCGYLDVDREVLAGALGVAPDILAAVLERCRRFEPAGLFARDLADCLALQLERLDRLDPAMRALIGSLELVAQGRRAELCDRCGVDETDLTDMLAEIRTLDPKPGLCDDGEPAPSRIPDVLVTPDGEGAWHVDLNPHALPRVLVDRAYHARVLPHLRSEEDRRFVSERLQRATWLERSLDQRARTMLAVATEIVRRQSGFLERGIAALQPMNLRAVAEKVNLHESTVSRAVANKTMATPRGQFGLKMFFSGAIAAIDGGADHAAEAVKHRIRTLIDAESPNHILSDDALAKILRKDLIGIARRTVAKYRESLGLGSSVERRRQKRAASTA